MMPEQVREYLMYNPLLNVSEFLRYSFFVAYDKQYYDLEYSLAFMLILLFMGLLMLRALRQEILRR